MTPLATELVLFKRLYQITGVLHPNPRGGAGSGAPLESLANNAPGKSARLVYRVVTLCARHTSRTLEAYEIRPGVSLAGAARTGGRPQSSGNRVSLDG